MALKIKKKKKQERATVLDQWVEIEVIDGVTKTTRYPSDEEMAKLIEKNLEETGRDFDLIYRRFNFIHGVPGEYHWTTDDANQREMGGHAIQRLCVEDWRLLVIKEKGGHMHGSDFHMPRPESRGGCQCEACQTNAARIENMGR